MIGWTIETALSSGLFEQVIVSTDDDEIAGTATKFGANVPFKRSAALSGDHVATRPVVNDAIEQATKAFGEADAICVIYATAALLEVGDLKQGHAYMTNSDVDFAFSVTSFAYPIQRALYETAEGGLAMFQPEHRQARSQDLKAAYHDAGQFYWGRPKAFLDGVHMFSDAARGVKIPNWRIVDIDTEEDWQRAEQLFKMLRPGTAVNGPPA